MKLIHGMNPVDFDLMISRKYGKKREDARVRNLSFTLTFAQFRHLFTRKNCVYTGIQMTVSMKDPQPKTDITVERIDANRGYEVGNVIAVCKAANAFKGLFEDPVCILNVEQGIRMFAKIDQLQRDMK